jgi:DNA-binding Xre family transcriptional regulator
MTSFPETSIPEFVNALQLSIESSINSAAAIGTESIIINFDVVCSPDTRLDLFTKFFPGTWNKKHESYEVNFIAMGLDLSLVTNFLLLTRLNPENIKRILPTGYFDKILLRQPKEKEALSGKINSDFLMKEVKNNKNIKAFFFELVEEKKMTLREISENSGITQATIHNFKTGVDIRLSTFLKLCQSLKIKIFLC